MKIRFYDEIKDTHELALHAVSVSAFGGTMSAERIDIERKNDPRLSRELGVFAVDGDRLLGQVIMYEFPAETLEGGEKVGGLAGVMTNPDVARTGIATALIERCHQLFREKGMRLSFLMTSRSLVGYNLYRKLGYEAVVDSVIGIRTESGTGKKRPPLAKCTSLRDGDGMLDVHRRCTEGLLGFVHRPDEFFSWRLKEGFMSKGDVALLRRKGEGIAGYAIRHKRDDILNVNEVLAPREEDFGRLVDGLADRDTRCIVMWRVSNPVNRERLRRLGFTIFDRTWGCIMALDVERRLKGADIVRLFGIPKRFNILGHDGF